MTRKALDLLGGAICLLLALVLLVVGVKAYSLGNFAHDNVRTNLEEQRIFSRQRARLRPTSGRRTWSRTLASGW